MQQQQRQSHCMSTATKTCSSGSTGIVCHTLHTNTNTTLPLDTAQQSKTPRTCSPAAARHAQQQHHRQLHTQHSSGGQLEILRSNKGQAMLTDIHFDLLQVAGQECIETHSASKPRGVTDSTQHTCALVHKPSTGHRGPQTASALSSTLRV
jgi:hypothetical protein